jgi:chromosome segregation ATPase
MEVIIVDTEKTACKCIQMLKDQMLEVETFLPLDYLQAKPLKERLRTILNPRNLKSGLLGHIENIVKLKFSTGCYKIIIG